MDRKRFLKTIGTGSLALALAPNMMMAKNLGIINLKSSKKLTILHTNDQHSRIEPFDESYTKNPNQGGFARRASLIQQIRNQEDNILLLDSGDIFQGTPYFNFFGGELEFKLTPRECLSLMGFNESFEIVVSDTATYKQSGNSIIVDVLMSILKQMDITKYGVNY